MGMDAGLPYLASWCVCVCVCVSAFATVLRHRIRCLINGRFRSSRRRRWGSGRVFADSEPMRRTGDVGRRNSRRCRSFCDSAVTRLAPACVPARARVCVCVCVSVCVSVCKRACYRCNFRAVPAASSSSPRVGLPILTSRRTRYFELSSLEIVRN